MKTTKRTSRNATANAAQPTPPVEVNIRDSARVEAALSLARAIETLAGVIAGHAAHVTIANNHITGASTAISVKTTV